MLNTAITKVTTDASAHAVAIAIQRVMIVNGSFGILELIETILEAGPYDVVFVSSNEHAYSQIKRVQPDLVILCVGIDRLDGFQVLSMLKLDKETRNIPVLTYTTSSSSHEWDEEEDREPIETELFNTRRLELMN
jgi:PleD family two-component response regulator